MFNIDQTTVDKEESGVWTRFRGSEFLIASSGSNRFQKIFAKLQMPYRKEILKNRLDPETQIEIMSRALSRAVVLDWRDVTNNDGENVPYDVEICYNVIRNNAEFRDFVTDFATEISNFISEERDELGKFAEKSSTGKSNTEAA